MPRNKPDGNTNVGEAVNKATCTDGRRLFECHGVCSAWITSEHSSFQNRPVRSRTLSIKQEQVSGDKVATPSLCQTRLLGAGYDGRSKWALFLSRRIR